MQQGVVWQNRNKPIVDKNTIEHKSEGPYFGSTIDGAITSSGLWGRHKHKSLRTELPSNQE